MRYFNKAMLVASAALCLNLSVFSQNITLKTGNVTVKEAMEQLKKSSGYSFVFSSVDVNTQKRVSVSLQDASIEEAVEQILKGQDGLNYEVKGKKIIIQKVVNRASDTKVEVKGKIVDINGEPIIGATVKEKGTSNGTITDFDGNFILETNSGSILDVSYIGYRPVEVKTVPGKLLSVVLKEDTQALEEVVVVGYGVQKKVNLTGSVGNVSLKDLGDRPITNASNALQGTVSGVYALQKSGQPGADGAVINIRGVGTLNNSDPLVLIDGFPGSMSDVDAADISSISVLKDAASAAIYGNRAANGVVLITTKKGKAGKVSLSYNGYFGVQEATALPKTLNSYEYTTLYNEACRNSGQQEKYLPEQIQKYKDGTDPMYPSIDYFDVYYDKASMQNHRLNVTGGSETFQYAIMLGYLDQDGILVGTNYRKTDFRTNIDSYLLNKRLRVTTRLSGNYGVKNEPTELWNAKWYATNAPIFPLKNEDGLWMSVNGERNYYGEIMEGSTSKAERYVFNGQLEAELDIWNGLSA